MNMEKKCFIKSSEGCIIEDSDVIIVGFTTLLAVALSVPLLSVLNQIPKR